MSKKKHNYINIEKTLILFKAGYGFKVRIVNDYHMRISDPDTPKIFLDYYHTTGTAILVKDGYQKNIGVYFDPEDVALLFKKQMYEEQNY